MKQDQFYHETVRAMIKSLIEGQSGCVMAFGPTGSGKSHTLVGDGTKEGKGLLPRAVQDALLWLNDRSPIKR